MKFKFKVSGSSELARELKAAKDNIRKEVEEEIVETLETTKSDVVSRVPRDTGNLASSFNIEGSHLKYSLYTDENYAGYLEFGTRSRFETGMPEEWQEEARKFQNTSKGSFEEAKRNITEWARRKGIPENEIGSVIFAIMRYGIRSPRFNPKPFFRPAVAQNVTGVEDRIEERIQTQLNKI